MIADHSELRGLGDTPFQRYDELTYRVRLPERASWIEVAASPDGPILSPTFASGQSTIPIFSRIPVTTLDFTRQESSGERVSALTGEGTMTFPDYPHLGTVPIKKNEAIGLEHLDRFTIQEISLTAKASGMHLVADGMAKQIRTKDGQIPVQHRLTALDALWHNARLAVVFTIITAVFSASLGAYRLWKEFKR